MIKLTYILAGFLHTQTYGTMPECIMAMQDLRFHERVQARCETHGITVHWKDIGDAKQMPATAEEVEPETEERNV